MTLNLSGFCLIAFVAFCLPFSLYAQFSNAELPLDPSIRAGKLPNGMVYYIKANATPKNRVELRLAVNAGSLLEEDDQRGLAHFTEHMAFNGTKNFSKNEIVNLLQKFGVKFGADINAYTSFDETVYQLQLPTDSAEILNKGFQILEDWAHNVSFEGEEIDKERGIIIEEWRSRDLDASARMMAKTLPVLYKGSKYPMREPIGTKEIIETFKHERIRQFYKDWYRTDLMAVVVVGDINPDEMEKKVKEQFGKIPATPNPKPRPVFDVPDHEENLVVVAADKETMMSSLQIMFKRAPGIYQSLQDKRKRMATNLMTQMLNARFDEIRYQSNPPFMYAGAFDGETWSRNKDAFQVYAGAANDDYLKAISAIFQEFERAKRFGFTATELERAKKQALSGAEKSYNERNTTESRIYCYRLVSNFLENNPVLSPEVELETTKKFVSEATLEEINKILATLVTEKNCAMSLNAVEKEGIKIPSEAEIREAIAQTKTMTYTAYTDKVVAAQLLKTEPKAGKILKSETNAVSGITELTLSNGLRVLLKPTEFKQDEILFTAFSNGGQSLYNDKQFISAAYAGDMTSVTGIGDFSPVDLRKALAGKNVYVAASVGVYEEKLYAQAKTSEAAELMQIVHLNMTAPRYDAEAAKNFVQMQIDEVKNLMNSPEVLMQIESAAMMNNYSKREIMIPTEAIMKQFDAKTAIKFHKERFGNASDFTMLFVGKFDMEAMKPLIEKYLASLPSTQKAEKFKDLGIRPPKGILKKEIFVGVDEKSSVSINFHRQIPYSQNANVKLLALGELMDLRLTEVLREDKGGVYSPYCGASFSRRPVDMAELTIFFDCSPTNAKNLAETTFSILEKIQKEGPQESDLLKVKEGMKREFEANLQQNRFWLRSLERTYLNNDKFNAPESYLAAVEALTLSDLQNAAKDYAQFNSYAQLIRYPESYKNKK